MGKITGFIEYRRENNPIRPAAERIKDFAPFRGELTPEERAKQGGRCMDCGVPLCQSAMELKGKIVGCPLHNLIPEWNDEIWRGHLGPALSRLLKTNPFPEFTGRVCPALCEKACICGLNDAPVTIRENELFIIESAFAAGIVQPRTVSVRSGKKVAVVGSGPAGLSCADRLNMRGHSVTVFEKADRIGGLMMYGIPDMKLPKDVIDRRRELMEAEGITFRTACDVGRDVTAEELLRDYDAVVVAAGARKPRELKVEGYSDITTVPGVWYALDFLTEAEKELLASTGAGAPPEAAAGVNAEAASGTRSAHSSGRKKSQSPGGQAKGKHIVVVGGGDTAVDCIGTCLRFGCASITQLIRRPEPPAKRRADNPWPEYPAIKETGYGQLEAAARFGKDPRVYRTIVKELCRDANGHLNGLVTIRADRGEDGKMTPVPGTEQKIHCDLLLLATGFSGMEQYTAEAFGLGAGKNAKASGEGCVSSGGTGGSGQDAAAAVTAEAAGSNAAESGKPDKVFICGDARCGATLVVRALAEGRTCAKEVDTFLMGYSNL
jgi:glutamate synthase (NADPH/NADH) small chain